MNSLFEDLCTGLQEAIDFEKGIGSAKKTTYVISPIKEFNPKQIRQIRNQITLYFPLSNEHYLAQSNIEKLSITLDRRLGML